jgi:hypothetical protein
MYPKPVLPQSSDVAELACRQKEAYPGQPLGGATVDVTSAYNQFAQSTASAKLQATQLLTLDRNGDKLHLILIWLVGIFGFTRAGNIYCVCGKAIDELHNWDQPVRRSETYIDDGIIITPHSVLPKAVEEYKVGITALFGNESVNAAKDKMWRNRVEAIGWEFDLENWFMIPKKKSLAKLIILLFEAIPPGSRIAKVVHLEKLTGGLSWYSSGLPAGNSFLTSLFACQFAKYRKGGIVNLSRAAIDDLQWWRAIILTAYINPNIMGANISSIRRELKAEIYLRSDASSTIGGGAYISESLNGDEVHMDNSAIRWTREELDMFKQENVSINVLEYFTAIYYIMLWVSNFRGKVVHIECDNTAAVSWLLKRRTKNHPTANSLVKLFSLFCMDERIYVFSTHIAGVDNIIADVKSRDLDLLPQQADEVPTSAGNPSEGPSRKEYCRRLLTSCVMKPFGMPGQVILKELMHLRGIPG